MNGFGSTLFNGDSNFGGSHSMFGGGGTGSGMKINKVVSSIKEQLEDHLEEEFASLLPDDTMKPRDFDGDFNSAFNSAFEASRESFVRVVDVTKSLNNKMHDILGFYSLNGGVVDIKYAVQVGNSDPVVKKAQTVVKPGEFVYAWSGRNILPANAKVKVTEGECVVVGVRYNNVTPLPTIVSKKPICMPLLGEDSEPDDDDVRESMFEFFLELRRQTKMSYKDIVSRMVTVLDLK